MNAELLEKYLGLLKKQVEEASALLAKVKEPPVKVDIAEEDTEENRVIKYVRANAGIKGCWHPLMWYYVLDNSIANRKSNNKQAENYLFKHVQPTYTPCVSKWFVDETRKGFFEEEHTHSRKGNKYLLTPKGFEFYSEKFDDLFGVRSTIKTTSVVAVVEQKDLFNKSKKPFYRLKESLWDTCTQVYTAVAKGHVHIDSITDYVRKTYKDNSLAQLPIKKCKNLIRFRLQTMSAQPDGRLRVKHKPLDHKQGYQYEVVKTLNSVTREQNQQAARLCKAQKVA